MILIVVLKQIQFNSKTWFKIKQFKETYVSLHAHICSDIVIKSDIDIILKKNNKKLMIVIVLVINDKKMLYLF